MVTLSDQIWEAIKQLLVGIALAIPPTVAWSLQRGRQRVDDERVYRTEVDAARGLTRRAIDVAGDALALVQRYLIVESDVDQQVRQQIDGIEAEYNRVLDDYRRERNRKE